MRFKKGTRRKPIDYEKDIINYWKAHKTFEKSVQLRPKENAFVFYDGPPFLTGTPHHGHLLISSVKDAVARYWTMKGKRVERVWGWDCHGLPAEVFVENALGIKSKKEIGTKISIKDYVDACRAAMVKTGTDWEDTIERIGRWVEFKGAYKTMDSEFMESVWWAFKELYDHGKIYDGEKILVYCTKDATPISKSEVAMENSYKKVTDPSVYVYFELDDSDESLLAWTTTPWTLPANVAVAVAPGIEYSLIEHESRKFYLATEAVERVLTNEKHQPLQYKVLKTVKGQDLVGKKYHPLFENRGPNAHQVLAADFVSAEEGTGIVHEAPAYGEEDYELCKARNIPIVSIVDENGNYTEGRWIEKNIWDVNKEIAKTLVTEGRGLKVEYVEHDYPHCHRCGNKLMYRAHPSWFIDIQNQKEQMAVASASAHWVPKALQTGRFANIIDSAPDWNISRDRFWATPIPVWKGYRPDGTEVVKVVGSYQEFEDLTGKRLDDYHLPNVMNVEFEVDGVVVRHIGKVLDCWFESGSMPFAQFHYPFENQEKFKNSYPADFIVEAIDQTRGWFYSLTAVNVGLFASNPFKNLICTGFINASDGKKMSKKLKNYTDPLELMDKYSADSFRLLLLSSPLLNGEDFALKDQEVADVSRKLSMIWNMFDFFTMYAEVDKWQWNGEVLDYDNDLKNPLDEWIVSRLNTVAQEVDEHMQGYDLPNALKPLLPFIDDASNWYVRRSRRRFWKSDNDEDKARAYKTLHHVLMQLSLVMAPFTPFLSEELYRALTAGESVHLLDWPRKGHINEQLIEDMNAVRESITLALAERAKAGIKVRQPLQSVLVDTPRKLLSQHQNFYLDVLKEEVNVKHARLKSSGKVVHVELDTKITPELKQEGSMREAIRVVQNARKQADLNVDDRIVLSIITSDDGLRCALEKHEKTIASETLATSVSFSSQTNGYSLEAHIDGVPLQINLKKTL